MHGKYDPHIPPNASRMVPQVGNVPSYDAAPRAPRRHPHDRRDRRHLPRHIRARRPAQMVRRCARLVRETVRWHVARATPRRVRDAVILARGTGDDRGRGLRREPRSWRVPAPRPTRLHCGARTVAEDTSPTAHVRIRHSKRCGTSTSQSPRRLARLLFVVGKAARNMLYAHCYPMATTVKGTDDGKQTDS
jgi:hypothetical protein